MRACSGALHGLALPTWSGCWIKIRSYDDLSFFSEGRFQGLLDGAVFTVPNFS